MGGSSSTEAPRAPYVCTMHCMSNKIEREDIHCKHLIPCLLHFSPERQIQSPECEEKFTQSFRLVNTMKLRKRERWQCRRRKDCKLDLKVFRGLQKGEKSKQRGGKRARRLRGEEWGERTLKASDPCVTHSWWCLDRITPANKMMSSHSLPLCPCVDCARPLAPSLVYRSFNIRVFEFVSASVMLLVLFGCCSYS